MYTVFTSADSSRQAANVHTETQHKVKDGNNFLLVESKGHDTSCKYCGKLFRDGYNLDRHVKSIHFHSVLDAQNFMSFEDELEETVNNNDNEVQCEVCSTEFKSNESLFKHINYNN